MQPRIFTKTIDGQQVAQTAHSPADAVRLTFDGWREQTEPVVLSTSTAPEKPPAKAADDTAKAASK